MRIYRKKQYISRGDASKLEALGKGKIEVQTKNELYEWNTNYFEDVLYVPKLTCNLLSESKITDGGYTIFTTQRKYMVKKGKEIVLTAFREGNLFKLHTRIEAVKKLNDCQTKENSDHQTWHKMLVH